jgi:hypothetical protein
MTIAISMLLAMITYFDAVDTSPANAQCGGGMERWDGTMVDGTKMPRRGYCGLAGKPE